MTVFHGELTLFDEMEHPAPSFQSAMTAVASTSTRAVVPDRGSRGIGELPGTEPYVCLPFR